VPLSIRSSQDGAANGAFRSTPSRADSQIMAQKLAFDAALGNKASVPKMTQISEPDMAVQSLEPIKDQGAAETPRPTKILRPGSLLDIRV
jgi:hypothetical protein